MNEVLEALLAKGTSGRDSAGEKKHHLEEHLPEAPSTLGVENICKTSEEKEHTQKNTKNQRKKRALNKRDRSLRERETPLRLGAKRDGCFHRLARPS